MGGACSKIAPQKTPEQEEKEEKERLTDEFLHNPQQFIKRHNRIEASRQHMGSRGHTGGSRNFQIGPHNGGSLSLYESSTNAKNTIEAYFLPSFVNNNNAIILNDTHCYMFTTIFSGCVFIAWRTNNMLVVDHLNPNCGKNVKQVKERLKKISLNAQEILYVLSPASDTAKLKDVVKEQIDKKLLKGFKNKHMKYNVRANVFGVRTSEKGWRFFSKTYCC